MNWVHRTTTRPERWERILFKCVTGTTAEYPEREFLHYYPPSQESFECMTPNSDGSHHAFKSFQHYKVRLGEDALVPDVPIYSQQWGLYPNVYRGVARDAHAGYLLYFTSGTIEPYGDPGKLNNNIPAFLEGNSPEDWFIPAPDGLDDLISRSVKTMTPVVKAELSAINSLWELKDLASLKGTVHSLLNWATKPSHVPFRSVKRSIGSMLKQKREDLRVGSDVYLQWKFNIGPFISDVLGVYQALVRLERRLNDLSFRAGRPQVRHFSWHLQEFADIVEEEYPDRGWYDAYFRLASPQLFSSRRTVRYTPSTFHAQMKYNFNFTSFQTEHARLLLLLDSLGVNFNAAILWNAVPWSFVIDWVLGVSQWLDSYKVANMKPQINILEYLWSIKRSRTILVQKVVRPSDAPVYGSDAITSTRLPVVYETAYRRVAGLPAVSSLYASGLSPTEISLGAALVLSRRRRPTKFSKRKFRELLTGLF